MHSPEGLRFKLSLTLSAHVPEGYGSHIIIHSLCHEVTLSTAALEDGYFSGSETMHTRELDKVSPFNVPDFLFSALFS